MTDLINRPQYLNQLIQNKDVDLVKIVTGIRRCGKSSLLDLFHKYLTKNGVPTVIPLSSSPILIVGKRSGIFASMDGEQRPSPK